MRRDIADWPPHTDSSRSVALEVLLHGPLSRSEIAQRLDLSHASLTRLSGPLLEAGVLVEAGTRTERRAGRPSQPLDVAASSRHFVGIKLTGTEGLGVVTDLRSSPVASATRELASHQPEHVADVVAELTAELSQKVPGITALGVGLGGLVDENGVVLRAPFLEWAGVPLRALIEERTGVPTVVENDLVAFTEAEHWFGAGKGLDRFAVLTVGTAVGYGLVVHDRIVLNQDAGIGLVGHWPLQSFGPVCPEGHRGCAHAMLTVPFITREISAVLERPVDYDECLDLAESGNPAARRIVDEAGRGLGRLVAAVANLTMPQRVILGGEGVRLATVAGAAMRQGISQDRDPRTHEVDVRINEEDERQWCRGAAVLAIQSFVLGTATPVAESHAAPPQ